MPELLGFISELDVSSAQILLGQIAEAMQNKYRCLVNDHMAGVDNNRKLGC